MRLNDPVLLRQLQVIQKIIRDETWLEAERRGCPVMPDDRVVRENVCRIILRIGNEMRETVLASLACDNSSEHEARTSLFPAPGAFAGRLSRNNAV